MSEEFFEKHDLPSGGWVAFRDPKQLTRRQRKPLDRAQTRLGLAVNLHRAVSGEGSAGELPDADVDLIEGLMHACAVSVIADWSYQAPITEESLEDLQDDDYRALIEAVKPHRAVLLPDFEPGPREDEDGQERPTGLSPESKITSEGERSQENFPTNSELGDS